MSVIINGTDGVQFNDSSLQGAAASPYGLKNRIINGAMQINQRGFSGAITTSAYPYTYTLDRWQATSTQASKYTVSQSSTAPTGFSNSLLATSSAATSLPSGDFYGIQQAIEGFNFYDLNWGTANAQTVTLSFWVYSSLTGTFGGAIYNYLNTVSYPFTYSIPVANTWTKISITIPGATIGSWGGATNSGSAAINFSLGTGTTYSGTANTWASALYLSATGATSVVGTNGATFYITGVQLEVGSTATPFERRMYGQELALCQRYYWKDKPGNNYASLCMGSSYSATTAQMVYPYKVTMRTQPTLAVSGVSIQSATTSSNNISSVAGSYVGYDSAVLELTTSGFTARDACWMHVGANGSTAYVEGSAEL